MKKRILVVDDEVPLVRLVKVKLESHHYEVLTAHDGQEGLEKARREKPDLIILDIMLPKMNGYEICQLLKFDEKYSKIPVVMLTAKVQEEDKALGKETGADEYMTKPFDMNDLLAVIEKCLGEKQSAET